MIRRVPGLGLALFALFAGCGVSEETFVQRYAEAICTHYEECGLIDAWGGTYDRCVTRWEGNADTVYLHCDYDAGAARACLKEWDEASCEGGTVTSATSPSDSACFNVCGGGATNLPAPR